VHCTADRDRDTLLGELLGPRPHALDLRGAARCADRDCRVPAKLALGELQPPPSGFT